MTLALIVIDVQQGLCTSTNPPFEIAQVIERINLLSTRCRTQGLPVIFVQHVEAGLEMNSEAWQIAKGLQVEPTDLHVYKQTPDSFLRTNLLEQLQAQQISALMITGISAEYCVDTTTRRALGLGYPVVLVADAISTSGNRYLTPQQVVQHHIEALTSMSSFGVRAKALTTEQVLEVLK